jgi:hypothetical protein
MVTSSTYAPSARPSETRHSSRARSPVATLGVASRVRASRSMAGLTATATTPWNHWSIALRMRPGMSNRPGSAGGCRGTRPSVVLVAGPPPAAPVLVELTVAPPAVGRVVGGAMVAGGAGAMAGLGSGAAAAGMVSMISADPQQDRNHGTPPASAVRVAHAPTTDRRMPTRAGASAAMA